MTDPPSLTDKMLRPASTLILVRDREGSLEVYLLQRSTRSGFMGGLYVFPGGGVEPEDRDVDMFLPHLDMDPSAVRDRFESDMDMATALGFCISAIRETLEEAGVFLAYREGMTQTACDVQASYRRESGLTAGGFRKMVTSGSWTLMLSRITPWSRWITPEGMKKRFDTCFFLAPMPDGQTCRTDGRETENGVWMTPGQALEQNLSGQTPLSPPTVVTLTQLLTYPDMAALMTALPGRDWGPPVSPRLVTTPSGPVILEPWDPDWDTKNSFDPCAPRIPCLPGEPFSRIWCDNGVWKPIRQEGPLNPPEIK